MQQSDRMLFYWALAELARRHRKPPPVVATRTLTPYELQGFSQNGEDGVIAEIMRRIGRVTGYFVEFGIQCGKEGNCVFLADVLGWPGLFIEADSAPFAELDLKYRGNSRVRTRHAFVTPTNIQDLLREAQGPSEPDILSIDIDGNDFWVWAALAEFRPRVVIIEYNAVLDPQSRLVQPYSKDVRWDGSDYFGASLGALRLLGTALGYQLIHTELAGVNAFFIRDDLMDSFADIDLDAVPQRSPNYPPISTGVHRPDPYARAYLDLDREIAGHLERVQRQDTSLLEPVLAKWAQ